MIFPCENVRIKSSVQNFIASHRIPHAIMIESENEDSNLRLAQYIATAAVCDGDAAPCGSCKNCHLAVVGSHPDITYIESLEGKKNLSVNQIRDLRADAFVRAHSAAHRVFVIKDAHRMNAQAQNALLKVLEEPPKNVVFILLVPSKTMLLDTIISRCVLLSLIETALDDSFTAMADEFIDLLLLGSEYNLLKLLSPLEKSRVDAGKFLNALSIRVVGKLKASSINARALDGLFDDIKYYQDLLETNINMSLFTSLIASRSKALINK